MSNWSGIWWWGHWMHNYSNLSQYSESVSLWNCRIPHISFLMLATREAGKYISRKIYFIPFQVLMEPGRIEKSHAFAVPFKENKKAFNLTYSSSTLCGFMLTQTMWNSLRWLWGSSLASPLNVCSKCIKPDLSLKLTLLSMFMHNGWFCMLGAVSSLSVCCHATAMVLVRASFRNLRKVFFISRSTCTCLWLVEWVTSINRQENLKEINHTRDLK
jgi:hypothetical protein